MEKPDDYVPMNFVYCGRRMGNKGKLLVKVVPIDASGNMLAQQLYAADRTNSSRVIGGIYTGASFSEAGCKGLKNARYYSKMQKTAEVIEWEAEDAFAEGELATQRLEKDAKTVSEIERILRPLREMYDRKRAAYDGPGCAALERAVLQALKTKVRMKEK